MLVKSVGSVEVGLRWLAVRGLFMDKFIRVAIELIVYITFCFATVRW